MTNSVVEKVFIFTPVKNENTLSMLPALYLSPLFGDREIAVFDPAYVDYEGNQGCTRKNNDTSCFMTALKITTYILSLGILPLLAMLLNAIIRLGVNYYYINDNIPPVPLFPSSNVANSSDILEPSSQEPLEQQEVEGDKVSATSSVSNRLYSPVVSSPLFPFLDYPDLQCYFNTNTSAQKLKENNLERLERTIFSRIEIFDRTHYQDYWGVDITDEFDSQKIETKVLRAFLKTFYGPNPVGPGRVKDACLVPTVVPERIMDGAGEVFDFNLNLVKLAEHTELGHKATYAKPARALQKHRRDGQAYLIILLKDVVARDERWADQVQYLQALNERTGYGCETQPETLSQNSALIAHHTITGDRPFGDDSGMEGRKTYGRTLHEWSLICSGNFTAGRPLGGSATAELEVVQFGDFDYPQVGIAVLRKF